MHRHVTKGGALLFCLISFHAVADEVIRCPDNDFQCVRTSIRSAASIDIHKVEYQKGSLIEKTSVRILKDNPVARTDGIQSSNPTMLMERGKVVNLHSVATLSVLQLQSISDQPQNSVFKQFSALCPDIRKRENLMTLKGLTAQCQLNEDVTVHYQPEDIYWCNDRFGCQMGHYPESMDERLRLVSDGLSPDMNCNGPLIDALRSICPTKTSGK